MPIIAMQPVAPLRQFVQKIVFVDCEFRHGTLTPLSPRPEPGIAILLPGGNRLANIDQHGRSRQPPQASVIGPQTHRNFNIVGGGRHVGLNIMFQPTGFFRLFHQSMEDISDDLYDAFEVLGHDFRSMVDALQEQHSRADMTAVVERFLLSKVAVSRSASAVTMAAASVARRCEGSQADALADSCGISERQLERQFLQQVGMTPKRFEKVVRFRTALQSKALSTTTSWTKVTHDAGYYDQNHLIKDFRDLTGATPSVYLTAIAPSASAEMFDSH